jgi:hypothetical protein
MVVTLSVTSVMAARVLDSSTMALLLTNAAARACTCEVVHCSRDAGGDLVDQGDGVVAEQGSTTLLRRGGHLCGMLHRTPRLLAGNIRQMVSLVGDACSGSSRRHVVEASQGGAPERAPPG